MTKKTDPSFDYSVFEAGFSKAFGKDALKDLTEQPEKGSEGTFIPTPCESLNRALGRGGVPRGRVIEIFGQESSGKSTLALEIIAQAQRLYPKVPVAYVDAEQAVNRDYAEAIGVDLSDKRFIFTQENETEKALDEAHYCAKMGVSVVVIDSVASLVSKMELEEQETAESRMGGNAKAMSSHLRHMIGTCAKTGTVAVYLNQNREKIGVMFGSPITQPGGKALKFYSTIRLETSIKEKIKDTHGDIIGVRVGVNCVKNKIAGPYKKAEYDLLFGKGIDRAGDLIDTCATVGILGKSGSWYTLNDSNIANGRASMKKHLEDNPELEKTLRDTLWSL